jgi:[protein-PII] uridylyltransferase
MAPPNKHAVLAGLSEEKSLTDFVVRERKALQERWSPQHGGRHWMQEHAALIDAVLRRMLALSLERTGRENADGIAILATGGYGQRLLAPGSDVDVTFLAERDADPPVLRALFALVMDVLLSGAKMKVGYAYRTFADIEGEALDHQTQTALLDARLVAGDGSLFARFDHLFQEHLQIADFLFRKEAERHLRRGRADASVFVAEPDVKNGLGGLRDLQTAAWMGRVRFHRPGEALWRDLVRRKVITRDDLRHLIAAREFLLIVRCALHLEAGEQRDLLTRYRQEQVAARLGYLLPDDEGPDIQAFMQRYYAAAADINRISDKVVTRCLDTPIALDHDSGLSSIRRRVAITEPAKTDKDLLWPLRALDFCQAYGLRLALATEEAIQAFLQRGDWQNKEARKQAGVAFLTLLAKPGDTVETLRRMNRTRLLNDLLPEFDRCMSLLPYDPSHVYTIGEHSLRVLGNLVDLREGIVDDDTRMGTNRTTLKALDTPLPLYLSALLHDIGKQWPTDRTGVRQPHEETGAERVPEICDRLGCPPEVTATTTFLVRHHLLLARTSRLRDLSDPATIREVARVVGDAERLRMLYLLTYADTKAVAPGVLSEMNAHLLQELFLRTEALLTQESSVDAESGEGTKAARLDSVRERLHRQLTREPVTPAGVTPEVIRAHIEAMPAAYLLNTPPETMARHLAMVARLQAGEPVVIDLRTMAPELGLTEITVVTHDDPQPGLLAKLTGALLSSDVALHTVKVFTRDDPDGERIAIDTLMVNSHGRPLGPDKRASVEKAIRAVLSGEQTVADLMARRRKPFTMRQPVRFFHVDDTVSSEYTLLDVDTPDELGVVYRLATILTGLGWNIHAARLTAWGGNARCAFYLTDAAGKPIPAEPATERLKEAFAAA